MEAALCEDGQHGRAQHPIAYGTRLLAMSTYAAAAASEGIENGR